MAGEGQVEGRVAGRAVGQAVGQAGQTADGRAEMAAWWSRAKPTRDRWQRGQEREGGPSLAANRLMDSLVRAAAEGIGMQASTAEVIKCARWNSLCDIVRSYWVGDIEAKVAIDLVRSVLRRAAAS